MATIEYNVKPPEEVLARCVDPQAALRDAAERLLAEATAARDDFSPWARAGFESELAASKACGALRKIAKEWREEKASHGLQVQMHGPESVPAGEKQEKREWAVYFRATPGKFKAPRGSGHAVTMEDLAAPDRGWAERPARSFKCGTCGEKFPNPWRLGEHYKRNPGHKR